MAIWAWIAIGATALCVISVLVGLAIARILGEITRQASDLLDEQTWASAPLTRAAKPDPDEESPEATAEKAHGQRRNG